jgi:hypothetical protein
LTKNYEAKEGEVEDVMKMDYSFFRALVMHLYNFNSLEEYEKESASQDVEVLKQ